MAEEFYRIVGRNIRERRMTREQTLAQLAGHLGVSYQQLQKYEKGSNRLPAHMLATLALKFGCTADDLCGLAARPCNSEASELMERFSKVPSPELRRSILRLLSAAAPP